MTILDDLAAQFPGLIPPQFSANDVRASLQAAQYRPTPAAAFPNAPSAAPPAPASLPIPLPDPPMWLSPDGTVSYTGRPAAASTRAPANQQSVGNALSNNALTLMALGGGIAQGGIGRGLQLAGLAAEADRKQQAQRYGVLRSYDALTDAGVPRDEARAAIYDPHVMRAVAAKYFGPKPKAGEPAAPVSNQPTAPASGSDASS